MRLSGHDVAAICDRHVGIGSDGLLHLTACRTRTSAQAPAPTVSWFMDVRNADGSWDTMCGNGLRVLTRYLVDTGLCRPGEHTIATRAGLRRVHADATNSRPQAAVRTWMPPPLILPPYDLTVTAAGSRRPAVHVDVGTPHAVTFLDALDPGLNLRPPPSVAPAAAFAEGITISLVAALDDRTLEVRVHERGVGETPACGTAACAAVAAHRHRRRSTATATYTVRFPGGALEVTVLPGGTMQLSGPAVIVAYGTLLLPQAG
ncbi:diaminopimelate epimerase [Streptomyces sp. NPDC020607]|uniref:diaminopimelate epimerase n=1 Tax=Streptomyces sp. NPDC020607 TaxID=3365082 RepID=UPI0037B18314